VPIGKFITDVAQLAKGKHIQNALGARLHSPDLVTTVGDVPQDTWPGVIMPAPLAEILDHQRMHVLESVGTTRLDWLSHILSHLLSLS